MIDLEQQAYSMSEEAGEDSRGIWEPTLLRSVQSGKLSTYCSNLKSLNYNHNPLTLPQRKAVRRIIDGRLKDNGYSNPECFKKTVMMIIYLRQKFLHSTHNWFVL